MAHTTTSSSCPIEQNRPAGDAAVSRERLAALVAAGVLMMGVILSAVFLSSITPRWGELVKIIAVVMFVGSMVALALAMVGDAFRRR